VKEPVRIEHEYYRVNGFTMHVAVAGSGRPLILLHGFPETWYSWRHLMPDLARDFRLLAPDMRGYGQSEIPERGYDLPNLARDVAGLIEVTGGRAALMGHDWGGVVGWQVAADYPDRVDKYITVAGPHPARYLELLVSSPVQAAKSLYTAFFQIPWLPEKLLSMNNGAVPANILGRGTRRRGAITAEELDAYRESWTFERMRAGLRYYRSLARAPLATVRHHREHPVTPPVCVIWADRDIYLDLVQTTGLERYCESPPEIHVINHCSHWIAQERPQELVEIARAFIGIEPPLADGETVRPSPFPKGIRGRD
jgi:pimeloyl-ACP methyl ester carboxylesterase